MVNRPSGESVPDEFRTPEANHHHSKLRNAIRPDVRKQLLPGGDAHNSSDHRAGHSPAPTMIKFVA
jgi:hypothetical protein